VLTTEVCWNRLLLPTALQSLFSVSRKVDY